MTLAAKKLGTAELREALGRLVFLYGALQYGRPFLAPSLSSLALHRPGRVHRLAVYGRVVLLYLQDRLRARRARPYYCRTHLELAVLKADAKAEGLAIAVGGRAPSHVD